MQGLLAASAMCHCVWVVCRTEAASHSRYPPNYKPAPLRTFLAAREDTSHLYLCRRKSLPLAATLEEDTAESNAALSECTSVKVKFVLQKKCEFGQQFSVVGDDVQFGAWNPASAIPMTWSEGDIWTTELELSVGKCIEFKIILTGGQGELEWQPGPNHVFKTSGNPSSLLISASWSDESSVKVISLTPEISNPSDGTLQVEDIGEHTAEKGSVSDSVNVAANIAKKPSGATEISNDRREQTAKEESDILAEEECDILAVDFELTISNKPVVSENSEDHTMDRMIEDPSEETEPKLSVLEKDLNWARKALLTLWSAFRQKDDS